MPYRSRIDDILLSNRQFWSPTTTTAAATQQLTIIRHSMTAIIGAIIMIHDRPPPQWESLVAALIIMAERWPYTLPLCIRICEYQYNRQSSKIARTLSVNNGAISSLITLQIRWPHDGVIRIHKIRNLSRRGDLDYNSLNKSQTSALIGTSSQTMFKIRLVSNWATVLFPQRQEY